MEVFEVLYRKSRQISIAASKLLLAYGYGRPTQRLDLSVGSVDDFDGDERYL